MSLSGISPAKRSRSGPNSVYVDMSRSFQLTFHEHWPFKVNVHGILGAIGPFWPKWGLGRVLRSPSFLYIVIQTTFRQLRNGLLSPTLVTKRNSVSCRGIRKDIFKNFHFRGHLPPKSVIESRSNRHLTQSRLQVTGYTAERYCLLHVVQEPEFPRSVNFFVRRTVA